jgi:4-amino-4-deoxy-L-arabinose transferase-like glycosyltransferase
MTTTSKMRLNLAAAACSGLVLRLFLVLKFPVPDSGDAPFYIQLAWNWLKNGVYGFPINDQLTPVDMRVPGYPAFLAAVFAFFGNSYRAITIAQAVLDVGTCFIVAVIAARLAPEASRRRVALAGVWLAALCPFIANYAAVALTETLCIFLTALASLILLDAFKVSLGAAVLSLTVAPSLYRWFADPWFLGGILAGFGALVRPETPLLLLAAGLALVALWWRPRDWGKLLRAVVLMAAGLVLPLLPWAARNLRTLHEVQFLAPRYSELPGEFTPLGFSAWTRTWLWRFGDVYISDWKVDVEEIPIESLPARAFDSDAERDRIAAILDDYNTTLTLTPAQDAAFRQIAGERTARKPLRTWLEIPALRSLALWFTPRVELLPVSGHLWPLADEWDDDRLDFLATLSLIAVNLFYLGLALAGVWLTRGRAGWLFLLLFILVRTFYFAEFVDTPEPRYVLECFPAILAFGAQVFGGRKLKKAHLLSSTGSG